MFTIPIVKGKYIPGTSVYSECTRCRLARTRKRVAIERYGGSGNIRLMMIGEAPGEVEDTTGYPFVGRAGRILNFIIKYSQKEFHYLLTNAVGCRPCDVTFLDHDQEKDFWEKAEQDVINYKLYEQGYHDLDYEVTNLNRDPTKAELEHCRYHLVEMEQKYRPHGIVYLGRLATLYQTKLPSVQLKHPSWIDRLDYKLLPVRQEALKLSRFIDTISQYHCLGLTEPISN